MKVLSVHAESAGIRRLTLSVPEDFSFRPGQWGMFHCPDDETLTGAYSFCSSPNQKGSVEICFNRVGPLTEKLFALKAGDALIMKGPFGKWFYRDDAKHAVFVSEGTGLSPFRAMVRFALESKRPVTLSVHYAAASADELPFREDLAAFAKAGVRVKTKIKNQEGSVTIDDLAADVGDLKSAVYYLCGSSALVKSLSAALGERGVPEAAIRYEKWGDY